MYMLFKIRYINELLRFSANRHLWHESIEANCAPKIVIFRYFAFFLQSLFIHSSTCTHVRTVRRGSYAPVSLSPNCNKLNSFVAG